MPGRLRVTVATVANSKGWWPVDANELAARLTAVEDRLAIIELEALYASSFDSRDGAAWATLFTTDGIYQARGATPAAGNFVQGRDALARFCADAPFDGIHLMHLPHITVDGDTATSRIHLEFVAAFRADGSPTLRMVGFYDVSYVRSASRWLIARRVTTTMFRQDNVAHHYPSTSGLVDG